MSGSRLFLDDMVEGKRNRGKQQTRWRENIYAWSNLGLNELNSTSKDREQWKVLSHVGAQSAADGGNI